MHPLRRRILPLLLHPRLFAGAVLVVVLFLLLQDGFYTMDGWAHLANAQLLREVLKDRSWLEGFVQLNAAPVPNWGGHVVLASLLAVFPPFLAEKLHWALLFAALAFGARRYLRTWMPHPDAPALLLLPVLLGQLFVLGFYNFLWGVAVSLWCAAWWGGARRSGSGNWAGLFAATVLVWCCHGSCVPFLLVLVLASELRMTTPAVWWRMGGVGLAFVPAFTALALFDHRQQVEGEPMMPAEGVRTIVQLQWSVWYDAQREVLLTAVLGAALVLAVVMAARHRTEAGRRAWPLLAAAGTLLLAGFIVPDDLGYASYIGLRIATLAMLVLVLWALAAMPQRPWAFAVLSALALCVVAGRLVLAAREGRQALPEREVVEHAARTMRPGDLVLPIWRDDRWNMQHRVDVLGATVPLRVLENYECTKGYFPLVWSPELPPAFRAQVGYADDRLDGMRRHLRAGSAPQVDHIVLMGPQAGTEEEAVRALLATADSLGYVSSFAERDVRVWSRGR
ncbi:MAG: hypothetical protein U0U25_11265 [Flavobacteriales bacterium]